MSRSIESHTPCKDRCFYCTYLNWEVNLHPLNVKCIKCVRVEVNCIHPPPEHPSLPPSLPSSMASLVRGPPVASGGPQSQLACCSRRAWCGAPAAVCSLRPFLLWSLLCSSHLINNDCTSHKNFPFSIFCHPPPAHPHPYHTHNGPESNGKTSGALQLGGCDNDTQTSRWHNSTPGISGPLPWFICCGRRRELLDLYC